jgi:hypothetical protein
LQIAVHDDDGITGHMIEGAAKSSLMPEIAGKRYEDDARVLPGSYFDESDGAIGAAVVNEEQFMWTAGKRIEDSQRAAQEFGQNTFFVVQRDGEREAETFAHDFLLPMQ